jgi:hypothetical protein
MSVTKQLKVKNCVLIALSTNLGYGDSSSFSLEELATRTDRLFLYQRCRLDNWFSKIFTEDRDDFKELFLRLSVDLMCEVN